MICNVPVQARLKTHSSIARSTNPYRSYRMDPMSRYNYHPNDAHLKTDSKITQVKKFGDKAYSRPKAKVGLDHGSEKKEKTVEKVPPPDLGETQFPGLSSFKVSESKAQVQTASGYASALLKIPPKTQKSPTISTHDNMSKVRKPLISSFVYF